MTLQQYVTLAVVFILTAMLWGCVSVPVRNIITCDNSTKQIEVDGPVTKVDDCFIFYDSKGNIHKECKAVCGVR